MVLGYHIILSAYGFWLPNDPRGSWSDFVGAWELLRFGRATKVETRRSVASRPHDHHARQAAKRVLKYPPIRFTGVQARAVGRGLATLVASSRLTVWACAILPEHMHLVIARHDRPVEQIANHLKGETTRQMVHENLHPLAAFPTRTGVCPKCGHAATGRSFWTARRIFDGPSGMSKTTRLERANRGRGGRLYNRLMDT